MEGGGNRPDKKPSAYRVNFYDVTYILENSLMIISNRNITFMKLHVIRLFKKSMYIISQFKNTYRFILTLPHLGGRGQSPPPRNFP